MATALEPYSLSGLQQSTELTPQHDLDDQPTAILQLYDLPDAPSQGMAKLELDGPIPITIGQPPLDAPQFEAHKHREPETKTDLELSYVAGSKEHAMVLPQRTPSPSLTESPSARARRQSAAAADAAAPGLGLLLWLAIAVAVVAALAVGVAAGYLAASGAA